MYPFRLFAATGSAVARLDSVDAASVQSTIVLGGEHQPHKGHIVNGVMCIAALPDQVATCQPSSGDQRSLRNEP